MKPEIRTFRILLEKCEQLARNAQKAINQNADHVAANQSAKLGAYFEAAAVVAEQFGFDFRQEQAKWIEDVRGIRVELSNDTERGDS